MVYHICYTHRFSPFPFLFSPVFSPPPLVPSFFSCFLRLSFPPPFFFCFASVSCFPFFSPLARTTQAVDSLCSLHVFSLPASITRPRHRQLQTTHSVRFSSFTFLLVAPSLTRSWKQDGPVVIPSPWPCTGAGIFSYDCLVWVRFRWRV